MEMAGPFPEGRKRQDSKQFSHGFGVRKRVVDRLPFYVLQNVFDVAVRIQAVDDRGPDDGEQLDCVYGAGFAPGGLERLPVDDKRFDASFREVVAQLQIRLVQIGEQVAPDLSCVVDRALKIMVDGKGKIEIVFNVMDPNK